MIVKSDLKYKKIPNKMLGYLLLLLPFWWWFLFISPDFIKSGLEINFLLFLWQIFLTFLISFILYYFWIWSAWDAKYLLVLALFIPYIWVVTFIGNIALLTVWYLLLYFIWFYLGKCLFNWQYSKSLYLNIYNDLKEKIIIFLRHSNGNFYKKIIIFRLSKWLIAFFVIFVSIRLARLFLFDEIFVEWWDYNFLLPYIQEYFLYIFIAFIGIFIWVIIWIRWLYWKINQYLSEKLSIKSWIIDIIFLIILFLILISFIIYEYLIKPEEIITMLYRIFTIMLLIALIFIILRYAYKITFSTAETYYVDIKDLKEGDIVDKEYLMKIFHFYVPKNNKSMEMSIKNIEYLKTINLIINRSEVKKLNKRINKLNLLHKNQFEFKPYEKIKILNTFTFWWYILLWFIISFFLWNYLFIQIMNYFLNFIKNGQLHL